MKALLLRDSCFSIIPIPQQVFGGWYRHRPLGVSFVGHRYMSQLHINDLPLRALGRTRGLSHVPVKSFVTETEFLIRVDETLDGVERYIDQFLEKHPKLASAVETESGGGVISIRFPSRNMTFVINRQTPNREIWLSSPMSGPSHFRMQYDGETKWIDTKNGKEISNVLFEELESVLLKLSN